MITFEPFLSFWSLSLSLVQLFSSVTLAGLTFNRFSLLPLTPLPFLLPPYFNLSSFKPSNFETQILEASYNWSLAIQISEMIELPLPLPDSFLSVPPLYLQLYLLHPLRQLLPQPVSKTTLAFFPNFIFNTTLNSLAFSSTLFFF
jgi:hypothetical protein